MFAHDVEVGVVVEETGQELEHTRSIMLGSKNGACQWITGMNRSAKSARFSMAGIDGAGNPTNVQVFSGPPAAVVKKLNKAVEMWVKQNP